MVKVPTTRLIGDMRDGLLFFLSVDTTTKVETTPGIVLKTNHLINLDKKQGKLEEKNKRAGEGFFHAHNTTLQQNTTTLNTHHTLLPKTTTNTQNRLSDCHFRRARM